MSGIAEILLSMGMKVSGSDLRRKSWFRVRPDERRSGGVANSRETAYDNQAMSSKRKWQVSSFRTWNRRDFSVQLAGFYTILKPTGWFAALPLPGGFRYRWGQPKGPASQQAYENSISVPKQRIPGYAGSQEATMRLQIMAPSTHERRLIRPALIVLAAIAITSLLLWWIMAGAPSNRY
jgi:hypothetical protein